MAHLTCKTHKKRAVVVSIENQPVIVHRNGRGGSCTGRWLLMGRTLWSPENVVSGNYNIKSGMKFVPDMAK